jgi:hypothetical protein
LGIQGLGMTLGSSSSTTQAGATISGLGAAVTGADSSSAAATSAAASLGVSPTSPSLANRSVTLNGTLAFFTLGLDVRVGPATFFVQRSLQWVWNSTQGAFVTQVSLGGNVTMVRYLSTTPAGGGTSGVTSVTREDSLVCAMAGRLTLLSEAYPGPGFSGTFDWLGG